MQITLDGVKEISEVCFPVHWLSEAELRTGCLPKQSGIVASSLASLHAWDLSAKSCIQSCSDGTIDRIKQRSIVKERIKDTLQTADKLPSFRAAEEVEHA